MNIKLKNKKWVKIFLWIFLILSMLFGLLIPSYLEYNWVIGEKNIIINKNQNKNKYLDFLKMNENDEETHIEGVQNSEDIQAILTSHKGKGREKKYSFYIQAVGEKQVSNYFKTSKVVRGYSKIDLSNIISNENIKGWTLSTNSFDGIGGIAFWTQSINSDHKYYIYTAGNILDPNYSFLGRKDIKKDGFKTFAKVSNPKTNNDYFYEVKELSLTWNSLSVWTKDSNGDDHLAFSGDNSGQYGGSASEIRASFGQLKDTTSYILPKINNEKIKDVAFDNPNSGFILTIKNNLFAAGSDINNQLGIQPTDHNFSWYYEQIDTKALNSNNEEIIQMSNDFSYFETNYQSLILLTKSKKDDTQKVWVLGFNGFVSNEPLKLGGSDGAISKDNVYYYTKLNNINLEGFNNDEKILYCSTQTYSSSKVPASESDVTYYSSIITKNKTKDEYKIYTSGSSNKVSDVKKDDGKKFKYNKKLTNKIFVDSGLKIDFDIENLGNSKSTMPVFFSPMGPVARGESKIKKQEKVIVYDEGSKGGQFNSWSTTYETPSIDEKNIKISNQIDPKNKNKGIITYSFNLIMNGNLWDSNDSKVEAKPLGNENYKLTTPSENKSDDIKKINVIISNIDISRPPGKDITYNAEGHKFKLKLAYKNKFFPNETKYLEVVNKFKPFTIHKDIKISITQKGSVKIEKNKFTYIFQMKQEMGYYEWNKDVNQISGLKAKIIKNSELEKSGAKLEFKKIKGDDLYSFVVTNISKPKNTFNLNNCISLKGTYKAKDNSFFKNLTWESRERKVDFGTVNFKGVKKTNLKIVIWIMLGISLLILALLILLFLLRKNDEKEFEKYESKKMEMTIDEYKLSKFVQERTKKEKIKAIKEWKKLIK